MFRRLFLLPLLFLFAAFTARPAARAIILFGTGDVNANTTRPGSTDGAGWDFEGNFGGFLGTPIGPHHFLTASHIGGGVGQEFTYAGHTYHTVKSYADPGGSDLRLWQVDDVFPRFAPIFDRPGAEVGRGLTVFGRGTQRGSGVHVPAGDATAGTLVGWAWGPGDGVQRWGRNVVNRIEEGYVVATFDAAGTGDSVGADEAHLSVGDSGGAVFIQDTDGLWKLAGINYGVTGPYSEGANGADAFQAAIFQGGGLYENDGPGRPYTLTTGPGLFVATQVSSRLGFINVATGRVPLAQVGPDVLFGFASVSGRNYRVEACDDLAAGTWTTVASPVAGDGSIVLVTDAGAAASHARRFYRAVTLD